MPYVIKSVLTWKNKDGKQCSDTSYFQDYMKIGGIPFARKMVSFPAEAMKFKTKAEARKHINNPRRESIEKIV